MRDGLVFANKRIIAVNGQGITSRSKAPKELGANNASQFTANPVGAKLARESARPSNINPECPTIIPSSPLPQTSHLADRHQNHPAIPSHYPSDSAPARLDASSLSRSRFSTFTASSTTALLIAVR
ncbi:hypothetical protein [Pseudomonas sp. 31-12]|uniref:hypothetical protein n=1 Tax=Pseudomonas sp. 31-12 TaxID=2201356 RepID=UPI0035319549